MSDAVASAALPTYQPRRTPRVQMLAVRGGRIAVTRWGESARAPIVLLHGWMDCAASFQFLADSLPTEWALAAVDWRGYGQSDARADLYWLPDNIADLEAVLEQLAPDEPAGVIAHSLGGTVASMYAGVRPQRLQWLANLEGLGLWRGSLNAPERLSRWLDEQAEPAQSTRYASLEEFTRRLRLRHPRLRADRARFLAAAWTRERDGQFEICADPKHRLMQPLRVRNEDVEACWAQIRCPVLMLFGSESDALARAGGELALQRWRRAMPQLQSASIAEAGHLLQHEQPEALAGLIEAFVRAHGKPASAAR